MRTLRFSYSRQVVYQWEFVILVALSLLMLLITSAFYVPGVVDSPQWDPQTDAVYLGQLMGESWLLNTAYYAFFAVDTLWAFMLLLVMWKFYYHQHKLQPKRFSLTRFRIYTILSVVAYSLDVAENVRYALQFEHPGMLTQLKLAAYGAVALLLADSFLRTVLRNFLGTLRRFLRSSVYSLVILAIIGIFLPRASQVNSIVVDLYLEPLNMFLLLILSFTFAVTLTHYPSYINIDRERREWLISRWKFLGLLGIVHYKIKPDKGRVRSEKKEGEYNYLLRLLGVCYFVGLFYMISYTSQVNYSWSFQMWHFAAALMLIGAVALYRLSNQKDMWYDYAYDFLCKKLPAFYDNDYTPREQRSIYLPEEIQEKSTTPYHLRPNEAAWRKQLVLIHRPIKQFYWILAVTILAHIGLFAQLFGSEPGERYNETTVVLSLICIALQLFGFVYYRSIRSLLRFSNYHPKLQFTVDAFVRTDEIDRLRKEQPARAEALLREQREQVRRFFRTHDCSLYPTPYSWFSYLGFSTFSSNLGFLWVNFFIGTAIFLFLLFLNLDGGFISLMNRLGVVPGPDAFPNNVFSFYAIRFNTILLILFYLFTYYGLFTALTKNYIYYRQQQTKKSLVFVNSLLIISLLLGYAFYHTRLMGNNIYLLDPVPRDTIQEVTLKQYSLGLDSLDTRYYIGCYGGGMKANAWTMSVLHELQRNRPEFIQQTVGISGASGGTMGWMNWSAILYTDRDRPENWSERVHTISTENILSMDITQMMGRDLFYYLFNPFQWDVGNRSESAMNRYAYLTDNSRAAREQLAFRSYWKGVYNRWGGRYPVLIANTTNVKGNHGMAVSVSTPDPGARRLLYQGADDILEIHNWEDCPGGRDYASFGGDCELTLSYYDAASTSNRFPVLSPAAKIETKGNYNDGGIYENSGLLSVFKLMQAITYHERVPGLDELRQDNVFVNIVNDKDLYVRYYVEKNLGCEALRLNDYSELSSLVSSVAATEMLPTYIKSVLTNLDSLPGVRIGFRSIYLPHRFTAQDVKDILGKELACGGSTEQIDRRLHQLAQENNRVIDSVLRAYLGAGQGRIPIVEPAISRVMAEPAYQFMRAMLGHPITRSSIEEITSFEP